MKNYLLKNGNKPFDLIKSRLCGAKNRQNQPCKAKAMKNGKCRLHGGKSTGAKTKEGRDKISLTNFKHGRFMKELKDIKEIFLKSKQEFIRFLVLGKI